jgi:hypothetical protein
MAVHTMGFTLMAKEASSRRELHTDARLLVAPERLQMRIDILAKMMLVKAIRCVKDQTHS